MAGLPRFVKGVDTDNLLALLRAFVMTHRDAIAGRARNILEARQIVSEGVGIAFERDPGQLLEDAVGSCAAAAVDVATYTLAKARGRGW
jgi:hypothetical protein